MNDDDKSPYKVLIGGDIEDNGGFLPILEEEDNEQEVVLDEKDHLPILPLINTVLFPGILFPISVGRKSSLKLVKQAYNEKSFIGTFTQKEPKPETPNIDNLYTIGTLAKVVKILEMPDGTVTAILQGRKRLQLEELLSDTPFLLGRVQLLEDINPEEEEGKTYQALVGSVKDLALKIIHLSPNIPDEAAFPIKNIENINFLVNFISANNESSVEKKQELLNIADLHQRAEKLLNILMNQVQELEMKNDIQKKAYSGMDKEQREYFLHHQMKQIQKELGMNQDGESVVQELEKKAKKKKWTKQVQEHFDKELNKLKRINPHMSDYSVQLSYLELMTDLPWQNYKTAKYAPKKAQKTLDTDHYGLEEVKKRIMEYLAVIKLKPNQNSPTICLYGPPGVGKTSLGKSIAKALNREYVRVSLGGVHDESEIRGHRRTYIGAMPGRIIDGLKKTQSSNPVFVLDEVDKLGQSHHGSPASALLEVLDPEQNNTFHDNYLDVDYDLSKVIFIATANNISNIPPALRDRMEMIEVSGYSLEEKIKIAEKHLISKELENHGLTSKDLKLSASVIKKIINEYTLESGVRSLTKTIAKICRHIANKVVMEEEYNIRLKSSDIEEILGYPRFSPDKYEPQKYPGVVVGLAWTSVGGTILMVESSLSKGKGKISVTGNLGDVMKESVSVALNYIKSNAEKLSIKDNLFYETDVHVHFPEGATPKDGPSAGITLVTSLVSSLTQKKLKKKLAMTGEMTLRGKVLPVGGIKEKVLAAKRAGIMELILPKDNEKNVKDIKADYIEGMTFHYVDDIMEVLNIALFEGQL